MIVMLMRGTKIIEKTSSFPNNIADCKTIYWDEFDGARRKSVFDYSHTTKRGMVFRERKINITSTVVPYVNY